MNLLNEPESEFVQYKGCSMYPVFKEPAFLKVKQIDPSQLRIGDIIVFQTTHSTSFIIHRIVSIQDNHFVTRGDNSSKIDAYPVAFENVRGIAHRIVKKWGTVPVLNGRIGLIHSKLNRAAIHIKRNCLKKILVTAWKKPFIRRLFHLNLIRPRICLFNHPVKGCIQIRFIWKNKEIGYYNLKSQTIFLSKKFRLITDLNQIEAATAHLISRLNISDLDLASFTDTIQDVQ